VNARSRILRQVLVVIGLLLSWTPTVVLGYFWLRWFRFFISIKDYGENDFATIFYVVIGLVVTGGTVVCGLLSAAISVGILRGLKTPKTKSVAAPDS
jgi:hypothetical protein